MSFLKKVLIVEDDPIIAEDIAFCLEKNGYQVAAINHSGNEAYWTLRQQDVDIIILDINLGSELSGIDLAEHINTHHQLPFIYLTSYTDRATLERAKHTRPLGYLVKPFDERDLHTSLEIALFNHQTVRQTTNLPQHHLTDQLTTKEREILHYLNLGYTNQQIAEAQQGSINTVKTHLKNIYGKLEVSTRTQALAKVRGI